MKKGIFALESVHFQTDAFFKSLVEELEKLRTTKIEIKDLFKSNHLDALMACIKSKTNISIVFSNGDVTGPAIYWPRVFGSNVLIDNGFKDMVNDGLNFDMHKDIKPILKAMDSVKEIGSVNLINSTVSGVYSKMEFEMMMPTSLFIGPSDFTVREVASAILHELGHVFTFLEFVSRTVSTNQVLSGLVRTLDKTATAEEKKAIFIKASDLLKMSKEEQDALVNAKNKNDMTCIVIKAANELSVSELGSSIYDVNSSEYLADQFATRHGAGRDLITLLDKFDKNQSWVKPSVGLYIVKGIVFITLAFYGIVITVSTMGGFPILLLILLICIQDKNNNIYDNPKARFDRMRMQNVERLKDRNISSEEKENIIESNVAIDLISKTYSDNLNFIEKIAYYLKPSYRNAHKFEMLQKDLEHMASNSLFESAAKLSTI
jgi:hypothetical protein